MDTAEGSGEPTGEARISETIPGIHGAGERGALPSAGRGRRLMGGRTSMHTKAPANTQLVGAFCGLYWIPQAAARCVGLL